MLAAINVADTAASVFTSLLAGVSVAQPLMAELQSIDS
jgi:hypothetical protein